MVRWAVYVTPPRKSVPDVVRSVHEPAIRRRTHIGLDPVRSEIDSVNLNVVAGLPLPGDA